MRDGSVVYRAPTLPEDPSSGPSIYTGRLTIAGNSKYREANACGLYSHSHLSTWGIQAFYVCVCVHTHTHREREGERGGERERDILEKRVMIPFRSTSLLGTRPNIINLIVPSTSYS